MINQIYTFPPPYIKIFDDLYFDFNLGLRVGAMSDKYRIVMIDEFSGSQILNQITEKNKIIQSPIFYYMDWILKVYDKDTNQLLFQHKIDLKDKKVLINAQNLGIGDFIFMVTAINDFQLKHDCKMTVLLDNKQLIDVFKNQYPNITFILQENKEVFYAIYFMTIGSIFNPYNSPFDSKFVGLLACGYTILGVRKNDQKPKIDLSKKRKIKQKYVCISTQASSKIKTWQNPNGWKQVVSFLKSLEYQVYQIDKKSELIQGCHDLIGNYTLQDRIDIIKDCQFFIGMSSSMAVLAWLCNVDVVMLCNLTYPGNQFYTPYRVTAYNCCYGCWHNVDKQPIIRGTKKVFDCDFVGTDRQYQCSKRITSLQVINTIKMLIKDRYGLKH